MCFDYQVQNLCDVAKERHELFVENENVTKASLELKVDMIGGAVRSLKFGLDFLASQALLHKPCYIASCKATNNLNKDPYTSLSPRDEWRISNWEPPPSELGAPCPNTEPRPSRARSIVYGYHNRTKPPEQQFAHTSGALPS